MSIFEAAGRYKKDDTPLLVLAGKEYGTGSSRDWAAKGALLLGIKAVVAESFERIHRSNLVGMGILPLQFKAGENRESLQLTGEETFDLPSLSDNLKPGEEIELKVTGSSGDQRSITVLSRIDSPIEADYYRHGGILPYVLRRLAG
jgi:aconitate hydratase